MRNKKLKESTLVVLWYCQRKVLTTYVIRVRYSEYTNGGHSLTETNADTDSIVSYLLPERVVKNTTKTTADSDSVDWNRTFDRDYRQSWHVYGHLVEYATDLSQSPSIDDDNDSSTWFILGYIVAMAR